MDLVVVLNAFGSLFRDIADEDYISARSNYQLHLREQFFWAGLQALEKYLKAILLYNEKPTLKYGHDLPKLLQAVRAITWLKFNVPLEVVKFLDRLKNLGDNRYMSTDTYVRPENLSELDESVWHVRAYCQYVRVKVRNGTVDVTSDYVARINSRTIQPNPRAYKPFPDSGFLYDVLKQSNRDPTRRALVWHNRFFGSPKSNVTNPRYWSSARVPPNRQHWFTPELGEQVKKFVQFPKGRNDIFEF
jgi:HEPN domain-containing protein